MYNVYHTDERDSVLTLNEDICLRVIASMIDI